jgi:hypothetical protein
VVTAAATNENAGMNSALVMTLKAKPITKARVSARCWPAAISA